MVIFYSYVLLPKGKKPPAERGNGGSPTTGPLIRKLIERNAGLIFSHD